MQLWKQKFYRYKNQNDDDDNKKWMKGYKNMATENGEYNTTCNMHKRVLYQTTY